MRKLLTEASGGICKGQIGHKSKDLKARQYGSPPEVIAYADKANERLRRKYYRMIRHGKKRNIAVTAVAREPACFIFFSFSNLPAHETVLELVCRLLLLKKKKKPYI